MSATSFDAVKRRYNFKDISFASWRDPALSVCAAPRAASDVFPVATYRVKYDLLPSPTDDEEFGDDGERVEGSEIEADVTRIEDGDAHDILSKEDESQTISDSSPPVDGSSVELQDQEDDKPRLASKDTPAAGPQADMAAEEQLAPPEAPSAEVEVTAKPVGEDEQLVREDSAEPDSVDDVTEDRKVSFTPGTPDPKPTPRKKKGAKGKKKKIVMPPETVQSNVVGADREPIEGNPAVEAPGGVVVGGQVMEVASSELQTSVEHPGIETATLHQAPVEELPPEEAGTPAEEIHAAGAMDVQVSSALNQEPPVEPKAEGNEADNAATLAEANEQKSKDPAAVNHGDTDVAANAPIECRVEGCDDPVTPGVEGLHASNKGGLHTESPPPNDTSNDMQSPADSGVEIGGTSEDLETANKADGKEADEDPGKDDAANPEVTGPVDRTAEIAEEIVDAVIIMEEVGDNMITVEAAADSSGNLEPTEGEASQKQESVEVPSVDAKDERTIDTPDAIQKAVSSPDEEPVAENLEQAFILEQEETAAQSQDTPPSPSHSKSSSSRSHKHRADHWQRKRKTEDTKVLARRHDRHRRTNGVRVEDRALPRFNRSSSSDEERPKRREESKVKQKRELVVEKRKADGVETHRTSKTTERGEKGGTASSRTHAKRRDDDIRTDPLPRKKTLPSFNLSSLPKALSLSSGSSVHGSTTMRRHSATWSYSERVLERPKSSRGRGEEGFRTKSANDARPESPRSRSPRRSSGGEKSRPVRRHRHHHHRRESEFEDYRPNRNAQEAEQQHRRRRSDVEANSNGRQRKRSLLASLLNL
ncbi:hypothetical protein BDY17DRAFT_308490 [Neohortaea acidophila]|uniref:Uncharacterized protein n=1 Tax=Neohortaea acidophila TaxID=245834 RepID=A0A6A6PZ54_9PEZI|nr:uncharacterized protein BDY17DRAFT_308490 [Neohortaea acidophila]KAF2485031.1 hypothetical protein BDY17DRAFT_308490 [Neohortaea acidophila]